MGEREKAVSQHTHTHTHTHTNPSLVLYSVPTGPNKAQIEGRGGTGGGRQGRQERGREEGREGGKGTGRGSREKERNLRDDVLLHELTAVVVEDLVTAYHRAHDTRVNAAREAELQDKKGGGVGGWGGWKWEGELSGCGL